MVVPAILTGAIDLIVENSLKVNSCCKEPDDESTLYTTSSLEEAVMISCFFVPEKLPKQHCTEADCLSSVMLYSVSSDIGSVFVASLLCFVVQSSSLCLLFIVLLFFFAFTSSVKFLET